MAKHVRPYNNFILVKPEAAPETTDGGLLIPEVAKDKFLVLQWGEVIRVSRSVTTIKEGDRIYFPTTVGQDDIFDGVKYKWLTVDPAANMIWGVEEEDEGSNVL